MLVKLEQSLEYLTHIGSVWWFDAVLVVMSALLLGYLVSKIFYRLATQAAKTKNLWDDALIAAAHKPLVWFVWAVGVNEAVGIVIGELNAGGSVRVELINQLAFIFFLAMFAFGFVRRVEDNLVSPGYFVDALDASTVRTCGRLLRVVIIGMGVLITLRLFGYSVSGVLAFGGAGGLVVGFAAKDLLSNFFGGLMLHLDRPFSVGDWVRSPDKAIEGTVEDVGWRQTRIRTFDKRPLYIPNGLFANIIVENPSRMLHRRIYETIGLRYSDMQVMGVIVSDVKEMLVNHPDIDSTQTLMVNLNSFAASSIDFFIYTFTKTTDWQKFHEIKQDILLKVADIVAKHHAEIAFPTSTLHMSDLEQAHVGLSLERDEPMF